MASLTVRAGRRAASDATSWRRDPQRHAAPFFPSKGANCSSRTPPDNPVDRSMGPTYAERVGSGVLVFAGDLQTACSSPGGGIV